MRLAAANAFEVGQIRLFTNGAVAARAAKPRNVRRNSYQSKCKNMIYIRHLVRGGGGSHRRTCLNGDFPVKRENTGKFAYFALEMAEAPRLSGGNSIACEQNSLAARAGKICGRTGNQRRRTVNEQRVCLTLDCLPCPLRRAGLPCQSGFMATTAAGYIRGLSSRLCVRLGAETASMISAPFHRPTAT